MQDDPTQRFSNRAAYYAKYRPRYPTAILDFMKQELGLTKESVIADIGSGTGILSELFLTQGNVVFGVEPNEAMRKMAENQLAIYPTFRSVTGMAEETTLPNHSVDYITAAQSFHWFEPTKTRSEFKRILRHYGWVVLVWNIRRNSTPFMQAYEALVNKHANRPYSRQVTHEKIGPEGLKEFLGGYLTKTFPNTQTLDLEGLTGRLLSSSYVPLDNSSAHASMLTELHSLFDAYQADGLVHLDYDTEVYYGQLID